MRTRYYVRMQKRAGVRLRQWLKDRGHTQAWLASEIGTHQTNVSAWMIGRPIPIEKAIAIRRVTRIPVEDWVEPADESRPHLAKAKSA